MSFCGRLAFHAGYLGIFKIASLDFKVNYCIHTVMPAQAHMPLGKADRSWIERTGYFVGALLLHLVVFLMIATLVIWKAPIPPADATFHEVSVSVPPPPPSQPPASGAAASNPDMEPQTVVVPVVTPPAMITSINSAFTVHSPKLEDTLSHLSAHLPTGSGVGPSGGGSSIGRGGGGVYGEEGSADGFVGTFYDLKQTPDRKPTNIAEDDAEAKLSEDQTASKPESPAWRNGLDLLKSLVGSWDLSLLDNYYKAPDLLSTPQICIPVAPSPDATRAYHVHDVVRARRWVVIYHAKVIPPETGKFRFIGFADDFMVVRVDGRNILDASLPDGRLDPGADEDEDVGTGPENDPLKCGKWIHLDAGSPVDMFVLIGENPGGKSGFLLMIQKEGDNSPKGDYPVFQLRDSAIPDLDGNFHFSKKKMIFGIAP